MRRFLNAVAVLAIALVLVTIPGRASPLLFDVDTVTTEQLNVVADAPILADYSILAPAIERGEVTGSFGPIETSTRFDARPSVWNVQPETIANRGTMTKARTLEIISTAASRSRN